MDEGEEEESTRSFVKRVFQASTFSRESLAFAGHHPDLTRDLVARRPSKEKIFNCGSRLSRRTAESSRRRRAHHLSPDRRPRFPRFEPLSFSHGFYHSQTHPQHGPRASLCDPLSSGSRNSRRCDSSELRLPPSSLTHPLLERPSRERSSRRQVFQIKRELLFSPYLHSFSSFLSNDQRAHHRPIFPLCHQSPSSPPVSRITPFTSLSQLTHLTFSPKEPDIYSLYMTRALPPNRRKKLPPPSPSKPS